MAGQTFTVEIEKGRFYLDRALKKIPFLFKEEIVDAFDHIGRKFFKNLYRNRFHKPPPLNRGKVNMRVPGIRGLYGQLRRKMMVSSNLDDVGTELFFTSNVARILEGGAVLKDPKGGQLAIPLSKRPKMFTARKAVKKRYKQPSSFKNRAVIEIKGQRYLAVFRGKKHELTRDTPLYVLKNQVRIQPKLKYYDSWEKLKPDRKKILEKALKKTVEKV